MSFLRTRTLLPLGLMAALLTFSGSALAQAKTNLQVLVASVSTDGDRVDPALKQLADDFKRSKLPWTSFKVVASSPLSLTQGTAQTVATPSGPLSITYLGEADGKQRFKFDFPGKTPDSVLEMSPGAQLMQEIGTQGTGKTFVVVKR